MYYISYCCLFLHPNQSPLFCARSLLFYAFILSFNHSFVCKICPLFLSFHLLYCWFAAATKINKWLKNRTLFCILLFVSAFGLLNNKMNLTTTLTIMPIFSTISVKNYKSVYDGMLSFLRANLICFIRRRRWNVTKESRWNKTTVNISSSFNLFVNNSCSTGETIAQTFMLFHFNYFS